MKKEVMVNFLIEATDGSSVTFMTPGPLIDYEDHKELTFIEENDAKLETTVSIYPAHLVIERTGDLKMKMEFKIGQTTYVKMKTNFKFELTMACVTHSLLIEPNLIDVIYQTDTDRENNITHHLRIKFE
jgi:uncharacterized beta-barrel protein YwiB (DUF1934 family)